MEHVTDALSAWDAALAGPEHVDLFGGQTSTTSVPTYSTGDWTFTDGISTSLFSFFGSADEWDQSGNQRLIPDVPVQQSQACSEQHRPLPSVEPKVCISRMQSGLLVEHPDIGPEGEPIGQEKNPVSPSLQERKVGGASQRRLATAREAQKRFRLRQKARSLSIEAQLADTTAELHESKARQQQLTNRNALLEKLAALNTKEEEGDSTSDLAADTAYERLFMACDTRASDKGPAVAVSVWGEQYTMGEHEVSQLSLREFSTLWTDYVRKLAKYLVQLSDSMDCPVNAQMQQLTVEAAALVFCLKLYNPETQNAFVNGKMDEGRAVSEGPGPAMYPMLLRTLELSCEQVKDLLQVRRLYLAKRAQLMKSREQLMEQMRNAGNGLHPGDVMTRMSRLATKLKMNAAEDYRVYNRTVCALLRGVFTTKQHAIVIVYGYPYIFSSEAFLEHLAAVNGEPTADMEQPLKQAFPTPTDWSDFDDYIELVASNIMHNYVPLNPKMRLATSIKHPMTVNLSVTGAAAESAGHEAAMLLY